MSMTLQIDGRGMTRHYQNVREISLRLGKIPREHLDTSGKIIVRNAKILTKQRLRRRTGRYSGSFSYLLRGGFQGRESRLEVNNTAGHAGIIEKGSRPHFIFPSSTKALRFRIGGKIVFSKYVKHPGTRAYNIVRDAVTVSLPEMFNDLLKRVKEIK